MPNTSFEYLNPLVIYKAKLGMSEKSLSEICDAIDKDWRERRDHSTEKDSWTGDVHGFSNLHDRPEFFYLFNEINKYLWDYISKVGINSKFISLYHTRSWAVRQAAKQSVAKHIHAQSHISVVYYPRVPRGGKRFHVHYENNPNEFCPNLFSDVEHREKGLVDDEAPIGKIGKALKVETDTLLIFPSKTPHSVPANEGNGYDTDVRYSISSDIICTLKPGRSDYEHLTPPITSWREVI